MGLVRKICVLLALTVLGSGILHFLPVSDEIHVAIAGPFLGVEASRAHLPDYRSPGGRLFAFLHVFGGLAWFVLAFLQTDEERRSKDIQSHRTRGVIACIILIISMATLTWSALIHVPFQNMIFDRHLERWTTLIMAPIIAILAFAGWMLAHNKQVPTHRRVMTRVIGYSLFPGVIRVFWAIYNLGFASSNMSLGQMKTNFGICFVLTMILTIIQTEVYVWVNEVVAFKK